MSRGVIIVTLSVPITRGCVRRTARDSFRAAIIGLLLSFARTNQTATSVPLGVDFTRCNSRSLDEWGVAANYKTERKYTRGDLRHNNANVNMNTKKRVITKAHALCDR